MALSAAFLLCMLGGTSWYVTPDFSLISFFVFFAALIVCALEIYKKVLVLQSFHDDILGVDAVDIFLGLEGMDDDDVGGVVGNHDVLVPTPRSCGEAACVVCVELSVVHCFYVEAMDTVIWWQGFNVVARRRRL